MANSFFSFKQFTVYQDKSIFKVGTDGVLLGAWAEVAGKKRMLDIGTGNGLVALMLAQRSESEIFAIEPDYESFLQAIDNFRKSRWAERLQIENCSLQDYSAGDIKFDLIVTNPPFFIDSLKNPDPLKSSARHDISLTHRDILEGAGRLLGLNGELQLILPYAEGTLFIAEAQEYEFYCNRILKIKPTPSSEIRRLLISFSRNKTKPDERFLTIEKGKRHEFTEDYINLTREFYLKF
jgi:tRNA1Val (adenine37-N6)-methyltransferase